jgi:hypothetical protein
VLPFGIFSSGNSQRNKNKDRNGRDEISHSIQSQTIKLTCYDQHQSSLKASIPCMYHLKKNRAVYSIITILNGPEIKKNQIGIKAVVNRNI